MNAAVFPLHELPPEHAAGWAAAQAAAARAATPRFRGPCFHPEFFRRVGRHYPAARVAVVTAAGRTGYLPHTLDARGRFAQPVPLCDYDALVSDASEPWDVAALLRALGVAAWHPAHLCGLADLAGTGRELATEAALRVELHGGAEAYFAKLNAAGRSLRHLTAARRRLERDLGPLRFELDSPDAELLTTLLRWKAERFDGGTPPVPWIPALLREWHAERGGRVRPLLSVLWAGQHLIAAHFGVHAQGVLHYWFPAFAPEHGRYSPGAQLIEQLIRELHQVECEVLDLGPGGERYKRYFANGSMPVTRAYLERTSIHTTPRRWRRMLMRSVRRRSWWARGVRPLARAVRRASRRGDQR